MMVELKLLYFDGCPNAEKVRSLLQKIGAQFVEIRQDDLSANDPLRSYTSPTVLANGKLVIGSITHGSSGGCTLGLPTLKALRQKLMPGEPAPPRKTNAKLAAKDVAKKTK